MEALLFRATKKKTGENPTTGTTAGVYDLENLVVELPNKLVAVSSGDETGYWEPFNSDEMMSVMKLVSFLLPKYEVLIVKKNG